MYIHSSRDVNYYCNYCAYYVIVIHWVTRNYGSKRTDPEGEVCLPFACHLHFVVTVTMQNLHCDWLKGLPGGSKIS